jgi:thiol-disulfide isomerase/thioredoxin
VLGLSAGSGFHGGRPARLTVTLVLVLSAGCASTPARPRADPGIAVLAGLPDVNGRYVDVSSWRGRVLVVQFLASWCFPCIATAPRLQDLEQRYGARGLSVVAVGMDLEGSRVLGPFQEQLGLNYPVLVGNSALREGKTAFGRITTLPTTAIIGRDGTLLTAYIGVPTEGSLEAFIEEALKLKP